MTVIPFTPRPTTDTPPADTDQAPATVIRAVYTVKEVATMLNLALGSTYAAIRTGEIPAIKVGGRWAIPKRRFHDWLDDSTDTPEAVAATPQ